MKWLMQIFKILLTDKAGQSVLTKKMLKWYKQYKEFNKKVGKFKHVYNLVMNPNNWIHALTSIPKNELNAFFKEIGDWKTYYTSPEFKNNERWMYMDEATEVGMPSSDETQVFKVNNKEVERKLDEINKEINNIGATPWVKLSSSWLAYGSYHMVMKNKLIGSLSLQLKNGKTYTYPGVPYEVWILMKEANGYNGTKENPRGAGSVFWKYFLDSWVHSAFRAKATADYYNNKISKDEFNIAVYQAERMTKYYYGNKKYKNDWAYKYNRQWYQQRGGKGYVTKQVNTYEKMFKEKSKYMTYRPAQYGFTTTIYKTTRHRNPNYINKREQADIKRQLKEQAKATAQPYRDLYNAPKVAKKVEHPIRTAKHNVKKNVKRSIMKQVKKWGK